MDGPSNKKSIMPNRMELELYQSLSIKDHIIYREESILYHYRFQ